MAVNKQRYVRGPQKVSAGRVQASTIVLIGELVALSGGYVVRASTYSDSQTATLKTGFYGVLVEGATDGNQTADTDCLVAVTGVYRFDIAATGNARDPGTPVSAADAGSTLSNTEVSPTTVAESIGTLADRLLAGDTECNVDIVSSVTPNYLPTS